jgi:predicted dithiol-disulfide oxidoreductase (DUF899 family)
MASETIEGTFRQTNLPNESAEYRAKREELQLAEIDLMNQKEHVSEMRRRLPPGPPLKDYEFKEGPRDLDAGDDPVRTVRLIQLFTAADRALIVYHMMFGKRHKGPCPMCTSFLDVMNGMVVHLEQKVDLAAIVAADPAAFRAHARNRGWNRLRLLSAGDNTFKYDLGSEDREGNQDSTISVFTLGNDGVPRHFYTAELDLLRARDKAHTTGKGHALAAARRHNARAAPGSHRRSASSHIFVRAARIQSLRALLDDQPRRRIHG